MRYLRYNTATIVTVGPFLNKTDGVTLETALTITNERISLTVDANDGSAPTLVLDNVTGATSGTSNDLNYISNCDAALMQLELSAANTSYYGRAFLTITDAANHCPVFHEFTILPQQVYDSIVAGTDTLQVDVAQADGTNWGSGAITSASIAATATEKIADALLGRNISGGGNSGRTVKQALHILRNKVSINTASNVMTVYDIDDSATSWTGTTTATAGTNPITAIDPD